MVLYYLCKIVIHRSRQIVCFTLYKERGVYHESFIITNYFMWNISATVFCVTKNSLWNLQSRGYNKIVIIIVIISNYMNRWIIRTILNDQKHYYRCITFFIIIVNIRARRMWYFVVMSTYKLFNYNCMNDIGRYIWMMYELFN